MNSIKSKAVILLFFHLTHSAIIQTTQEELSVPERELMQPVAIVIGGLLSGLFASKYFLNKGLTHWENDDAWDSRFLQATQNEDFSLSFLNLLLDSYAMEISNACLRHFQSKYELNCNTKHETATEEEYLTYENDQYLHLEEMRNYCIDFFKFVLNYSFINKYMMDARYALFYFKMNFVESSFAMTEPFVYFLDEMQDQVFFSESFRKIQETHQNYFYITVNYFLDSDNKLKKLKIRQ